MSGKDNEKGLRNGAFLLGNGGLFQSVEGDAKMEAWSERVVAFSVGYVEDAIHLKDEADFLIYSVFHTHKRHDGHKGIFAKHGVVVGCEVVFGVGVEVEIFDTSPSNAGAYKRRPLFDVPHAIDERTSPTRRDVTVVFLFQRRKIPLKPHSEMLTKLHFGSASHTKRKTLRLVVENDVLVGIGNGVVFGGQIACMNAHSARKTLVFNLCREQRGNPYQQ